MRTRLTVLVAALALMFGIVVTVAPAPPASAGYHAIIATMYEESGYNNPCLKQFGCATYNLRWDAGSCSTESSPGYDWHVATWANISDEYFNVWAEYATSSIKLTNVSSGTSSYRGCNYIYIETDSGQAWEQCTQPSGGISVMGPPWNDNIARVVLHRYNSCPF